MKKQIVTAFQKGMQKNIGIVSKGTNTNPNVKISHGNRIETYFISATDQIVQLFTKRTEISDLRQTGSPVALVDNSNGMAYDMSNEADCEELGVTSATAKGFARGSHEYLIRGLIPTERYEIFAEEDVFKDIWSEISAKYADKAVRESELFRVELAATAWHDETKKAQVKKAIERVEALLWRRCFYEAMQWLYYVENCMGPSGKTWWKCLR